MFHIIISTDVTWVAIYTLGGNMIVQLGMRKIRSVISDSVVQTTVTKCTGGMK